MDEFLNKTAAPDDSAREQARLEGQHEVILYAMGGQAVYAPIDFSQPGLRILDSGCANGRWLKDLAANSPAKHTYFGTDVVSSLYPNPPPPNFHFQNQSIVDPWPESWNGTFDLVHQRLVLAGIAKVPMSTVVQNFANLLKPSGWLQLVEFDLSDIEGNGVALNQFQNMLRTILSTIGLGGPNPFRNLGQVMEDAGFRNVQSKVVTVPHGAKAPNVDLAAKGIESPCAAIEPLAAVLKGKPRSLGLTQVRSC